MYLSLVRQNHRNMVIYTETVLLLVVLDVLQKQNRASSQARQALVPQQAPSQRSHSFSWRIAKHL